VADLRALLRQIRVRRQASDPWVGTDVFDVKRESDWCALASTLWSGVQSGGTCVAPTAATAF